MEKISMKLKSMVRILAALSLATLFSSPALAQEYNGYGDEWQHAFALYGWGVDINGELAIGDRLVGAAEGASGIDIGYEDLLGSIEFAFMGAYQARKGMWSIMTDVIYGDLSGKAQLDLIPPIGGDIINVTTDVKLDLKSLVLHVGGGYNLYNRDNAAADFIFGARYLDISTDLVLDFDLGFQDLNYRLPISHSDDLLDAFIGLKGTIGLGDRWMISYYGDIGTGDSDFSWQVEAGIAFRASHWADIALTYRHLSWDIGGKLVDDFSVRGPALGVVFRW
jgi:hypothetical protein